MKLKIIPARKEKLAKAKIQSSGKLGFNSESNRVMNFVKGEYFLIATDEDEKDCFYLIRTDKNNQAAILHFSALYYSLNCFDVFEKIGIKRGDGFLIEKVEHKDYTNIFKLTKIKTL